MILCRVGNLIAFSFVVLMRPTIEPFGSLKSTAYTLSTFRTIAFFSLLCLTAWDCSTVTNPTTATTVYDTIGLPMGTILGRVRVIDTNDHSLNSASVTVILDGTAIQSVTDSNGIFRISNVPAGSYNVTITKPGFGTCRVFEVTALGPATTVIPELTLGQAYRATVRLDSAQGGDTVSHQYFTLLGTSTIRDAAGVIVFLDLDSAVSLDQKHWAQFTGNLQTGLSIVATERDPLSLPSGTKLYASAAFFNLYSSSEDGSQSAASGCYYDPIEDVNRYISLGPRSNVLTLILR